jgi:hypothetical protein
MDVRIWAAMFLSGAVRVGEVILIILIMPILTIQWMVGKILPVGEICGALREVRLGPRMWSR